MIVILEAILSTVADAPKSRREYGEGLRRFQVFIVLRVCRRARDTKSGRMVVLENFDRLQLCSFSLSSRCSSRKATARVLRACTSLSWLFYSLQKIYNVSRRNNARGLKFYHRYELIAHSRLDTFAGARQFLINGPSFPLIPSVIENLKQFHLHTKAPLILLESTVLYKFGLTLYVLLRIFGCN